MQRCASANLPKVAVVACMREHTQRHGEECHPLEKLASRHWVAKAFTRQLGRHCGIGASVLAPTTASSG
jgi:hypothetical protein